MFYRGSRYEPVAEAVLTTPEGRSIRYKRVRFIPATPGALQQAVNQGDRLDLIAYRTWKDPQQFWRICDADLAMWPADLVAVPGRQLLIPLPTA